MIKEDYTKINEQNAGEIVGRILEAAKAEAGELLERARKDTEAIREKARREADEKVRQERGQLERELEKLKEKIFSTINLEKKRVLLEGKNTLINQVFDLVGQKAAEFRGADGYAGFFRDVVLEGVKIVGDKKVEIFYSSLDDKLVSEKIIAEIKKNNLEASWKKSDFKDLGVIIQSADGKKMFDNRFAARLRRKYDELYMRLLREA